MSAISTWILSITGIVLVGLLFDILLPNGKTNKIVKSVVALFTVLVIVSPLKNIDLNNFDFSNLFENFNIDSQFVSSIREDMVQTLKDDIQENLYENGYSGVKIDFEVSSSQENLQIRTVFVDLSNLVLLDNNLNINKYTNIVAIIKSLVDIKEDSIIFYEWRRKTNKKTFSKFV